VKEQELGKKNLYLKKLVPGFFYFSRIPLQGWNNSRFSRFSEY
jgi:hypothetical protein